MKKFLSLFFTLFVLASSVCFAAETLTWSELSQSERDNAIKKSKEILFNNNTIYSIPKSEINDKYSKYLKDPKSKVHYDYLLKKDFIPGQERDIYAHRQNYYVGDKLTTSKLIEYSIQYRDIPGIAFHYNSTGNLVSLEMFSQNYSFPPYTAIKYNSNGKMMRAYYAEKNRKYFFLTTGSFQGVLINGSLYNDKGKQIYNIIIE